MDRCWDVDAEIPCLSYPEAACPSPRCSVARGGCERVVSTTTPESTTSALSLVSTPAPTALNVTSLPTAAPTLTPPPTATPNPAPTTVGPTVAPSTAPTEAPTASTTTLTSTTTITTATSSTLTTTTSAHQMFPVPWTFQSDTSIHSLSNRLSMALFEDRFAVAMARVLGAARWQVEVVDVNPATGEVSGTLTAVFPILSLLEMNNRVAVEGLHVPPFEMFPATTVAVETRAPPLTTAALTPPTNSNTPEDDVAASAGSSSSSDEISRGMLFVVVTAVVVLSMGVTLWHMQQRRAGQQLRAKATMMNPAYDVSPASGRGTLAGSADSHGSPLRVLPGSPLAYGSAMGMAGSPMPTSPTPSFRGTYDFPANKAFTFNLSKVPTIKLGANGLDGHLEDANA